MENNQKNLTERQKRFADYYLETGNARKAASLAGYSVNYAPAAKRQPAVKRYLNERIGEMDSSRIASVDEVLEYLTMVLRGMEQEDEGKSDKATATRIKAAELLSKRLGMSLKVDAAKSEPVVIVDDIQGKEAQS